MNKPVVTIESTPCGGKGLHIDGRAFCPCPAPLAETWRCRMQKELDDAFDAGAAAERERIAKLCDAKRYATIHSVPIHGFATALQAGAHDGRLDMAEELAAAIRKGAPLCTAIAHSAA
ncbi:MAG: hypothetical protein WC563_15145 [Brevundimonas sp.]